MLVHSQSFEAEEAKSIERADEASNESNERFTVPRAHKTSSWRRASREALMLRLPWYVVLGLSVYCLLHMGLAVEHPCAVLGIASPVNRSSVTRAYRTLSICTHPDKQPRGSEAAYRGGLLFQRATEARKALTDAIKYKDNMDKEAVTVADDGEEGGSEVSCSTGLNAMLVNGAAELVSQLHATWQRGLAAASSRLGMTPAVLEAQILSKRFTIAALCAAPLVLLEGGWLKALVLLLSGLGAAAKLLARPFTAVLRIAPRQRRLTPNASLRSQPR